LLRRPDHGGGEGHVSGRTGFVRGGTVPSERTERRPSSGALGTTALPEGRPWSTVQWSPRDPLVASQRAVLRQGLWAPAWKRQRGLFSGVVVVILLALAIPETCAEGFSCVDATAAWWCASTLKCPAAGWQESAPSLSTWPRRNEMPPATRPAAMTVQAHTGELGGRELRMPQAGPKALKAGTRGNARRLSAAAERWAPRPLPLSSGRFLGPGIGAWAGVQRSAARCACASVSASRLLSHV